MRSTVRLALAVSLVAGLAGTGSCGGAPSGPPSGELPPPAPTASAPSGFENPGGMWMPEQLKEPQHADQLRALGLEIDPAALADPTRHPLAALVFLGGCSASFVSPDGLIVTNHHCVTRALQINSTPEANLLADGYWAKTRADEKSAGPTQRVFVTQAFKDVTARVREGLDAITNDLERFKTIEDRQKAIVAECEKDRPGIRCSVVAYFEGASYVLTEQLEIRDVRLVYAPPESIGAYGGEIDNWRWPRHAGDFAFYRAYVDKDQKPADFAEANVPYRAPHYLKLASEPLSAGDLVMVAGYPAHTTRWTTAGEVKAAVEWDYPRRVQFCEEYVALLNKLSAGDKELAIKAEPLIRGLENWLTNTKGMLDGLVQGGLSDKKVQLEKELSEFIDADATRKKDWGETIGKMATIQAAYDVHRDADAALWETGRLVSMLRAANTIVRMAEERPKPDADRDPEYQARNHKQIEQGLDQLDKTYNRELDRSLLQLGAERELRLDPKKRAGIALALVGKNDPTTEELQKVTKRIFDGTALEKADVRRKLLQKATTAELKASKDPLIALAVKLRPLFAAMEEREKTYKGAMSAERPKYVAALRAKSGGLLAPDANRSLRVTYGTVRGYRPSPDKPVYDPFTTLAGVAAKHTGEEPFVAPKALLDAIQAGKKGPYVHAPIGDVPVDFLADLDITGGNSGSATLNRKGELVGLAFDGNYEAMASDWIFMPDVTRSIHVDLRYILWVLDAVSHAGGLLEELGVKPSLH